VRDAAFEGASKYADWKFVHAMPAPSTTSKPAAKAAP